MEKKSVSNVFKLHICSIHFHAILFMGGGDLLEPSVSQVIAITRFVH